MADAKTMTNQERAKKAANERWNQNIPRATHTGILIIANQEIQCDVLNDGRRVFRLNTFLKAMGRGKVGGRELRGSKSTKMPIFLTADNLIPYLEADFQERAQPIRYKGIDGHKLLGFDAIILPEACKIYVRAEDSGILKRDDQLKIASVCRAMLYGLASVGIVALVDDATGYVYERKRNELQIILEAFIEKDLLPWTKKFPDEFFEQVYRLHNWQWPKMNKNHPKCLGNFINKYIYNALPDVVTDELKKKNPVMEYGCRKHRHHQWLTESQGQATLEKRIAKVTAKMECAENMNQFKKFMEKG